MRWMVRRFLLWFEQDANGNEVCSLSDWSANRQGRGNCPSVWTWRTFYSRAQRNFSRHGNKGHNTDFQTFQQKRKMARNYILIIFSFPVEMWPDSPAPFMASLSFWTSASGLKPAASLTVPRVPIWSWNNNQMCLFFSPHICVFELHCAEWLKAARHNKI